MNSLFAIFMSMTFLGLNAKAEQSLFRVLTCTEASNVYTLFSEKRGPVKAGTPYAVFHKIAGDDTSMPTSTQGTLTADMKTLKFPTFWRPTSMSTQNCRSPMKTFALKSNTQEVIREFYVKTYFIAGEPSPVDNIEDLVKNGSAIPLKVRVLCRSSELTNDISLCDQVTILDDIIPI